MVLDFPRSGPDRLVPAAALLQGKGPGAVGLLVKGLGGAALLGARRLRTVGGVGWRFCMGLRREKNRRRQFTLCGPCRRTPGRESCWGSCSALHPTMVLPASSGRSRCLRSETLVGRGAWPCRSPAGRTQRKRLSVETSRRASAHRRDG